MLTPFHAPTDKAQLYFPEDIEAPRDEQVAKSVIIFNDKSIFNAKEDESVQWGTLNQHSVRPKSKGSGIMVSKFIEEKGGYLLLSCEQFAAARDQPEHSEVCKCIYCWIMVKQEKDRTGQLLSNHEAVETD